MNKAKCLSIVALMALPGLAHAQEWTAEQLDIWSFIEECNSYWRTEDLDAILGCYHEDFSGWRYGDPVPRGKDSARAFIPIELETTDTIAADLRPISIIVRDDFAVVHYFLTYAYSDSVGNVEYDSMVWTDITVRENGRWYWLADHGGLIEDQ